MMEVGRNCAGDIRVNWKWLTANLPPEQSGQQVRLKSTKPLRIAQAAFRVFLHPKMETDGCTRQSPEQYR
jgi:hypothetical protein